MCCTLWAAARITSVEPDDGQRAESPGHRRPAEATAIGNLMVQVKASGEVGSLAEMRQVIRDSFDVETFEPNDTDVWAEQFERYMKIKGIYEG